MALLAVLYERFSGDRNYGALQQAIAGLGIPYRRIGDSAWLLETSPLESGPQSNTTYVDIARALQSSIDSMDFIVTLKASDATTHGAPITLDHHFFHR